MLGKLQESTDELKKNRKQVLKDAREEAEELLRRGFTYFDWNVSGEDPTKNYSEKDFTLVETTECE